MAWSKLDMRSDVRVITRRKKPPTAIAPSVRRGEFWWEGGLVWCVGLVGWGAGGVLGFLQYRYTDYSTLDQQRVEAEASTVSLRYSRIELR